MKLSWVCEKSPVWNVEYDRLQVKYVDWTAISTAVYFLGWNLEPNASKHL